MGNCKKKRINKSMFITRLVSIKFTNQEASGQIEKAKNNFRSSFGKDFF